MSRLSVELHQLYTHGRSLGTTFGKPHWPILDEFTRDLARAGFNRNKLPANTLRGRHVQALLNCWRKNNLHDTTIFVLVEVLRWWARAIDNPGAVLSDDRLRLQKPERSETDPFPVQVIYCCGCQKNVYARLTTGSEVYAHRADLRMTPFWKCDTCSNHVGCHHKSSDRTAPLGCIATAEIKNARKHIHAIFDPIWKQGLMTRDALYEQVGAAVGKGVSSFSVQ